MSAVAVVAICQFGGELVTNSDGLFSYSGGEAHAIDVDRDMLFDDFKSEINSLFNVDLGAVTIKYLLPNNKQILITVSCDKDLKRMVDFNANTGTVDVFLLAKASNGTTTAELGTPTAANAKDNSVKRKRQSADKKNPDRPTRSRLFLATAAAPDVPAAVCNSTLQERSPSESADLRIAVVNPDISITANPAVAAGSNISFAANNVATGESRILAADSGNPETVAIATGNLSFPYLATIDDDDIITGVGQEFDNVKEFRDKLCQYASSKGFLYKFVKNDPARVTVKCSVDDCPWRLHASQAFQKKKFMIKTVNNVHTCGRGIGSEGQQRRVTKKWLVSILKEKIRENPECKPKEVAMEIYRDYGVSLRYYQIWNGKAAAEKELLNMHVEACNQLPWFCERIRESNPGSIITLATSADSKFRIFVSFHASLHGFQQGCRPLIFLDRIPLRKNNKLKLFVAATVDGDNAIFPVAFAAVEADIYDSWFWFLQELKSAISPACAITFVSSRQNCLDEAVAQVFPDSYHSYCLVHLLQDFKVELKKTSLSEDVKAAMVADLESAAQAYLTEDFSTHIEGIRSFSEDSADWVIATRPEHWSNAFFRGARYNHFSADIIEFNDWISVKEESSVVLMINALSSKLMEVIHSRREASNAWEGTLTPSMEQRLQKEMLKAHDFTVHCSSETVFEVRGYNVNVVNTGSYECTCRKWQITGLPCTHAIAVLEHLGKSVHDFCSRYFRIDCYRVTYSESVHQIPDVENIVSISGTNLYPPRARQLKWPRRKRDRRKQGDVRPLHCSWCKQPGHNKATCEAHMSMNS